VGMLVSVTAGFFKTAMGRTGLLRLVIAGVLLALSSCAWLDAQQRQIIYRPTPNIPIDFAGLRVGDERYFVQVTPAPASPGAATPATAQQIELWWLPHPDPNAPTLLYFHGTFRNLFDNLHKMEALRAAGFAVLAVEYRGWGLSSAITPSEQTILQDAEVAWRELQRREGRPTQRVLYGHSMGSGVAVDLASRLRPRLDYGALILESAFTSFADVARDAGLLASLLAGFNQERFASIDKITLIHAPLLMVHGDQDTTIPLRLGQRLYGAANQPKQWATIEGGAHSDLDQIGGTHYQTLLRGFMTQQVLPP
jgi:pimeloyl-ACP methyl ester carboxylesterase